MSRHTVAESQLTSQSRIVADSADGDRSTEGREVASRTTGEAIGDDSLRVDLLDATYSLLREEGRRGAHFLRVRHFVVVFALEGLLSLTDDACHRLDSLEGVLTVSRLTREHDSVGAVVDSVSDVADLCTRRQGVVDHRVEHLRSDDDGLLSSDTLLDDHTLDGGDLLSGDFDSEVTTSDHDTIARVDDLVDVVDTFLVLDLSDDLDVALVLVEDRLDFLDVLLVTDERVSDELDLLGDRVQDVATVLLGERGQVDAYARDVDALAATELTVVLTDREELVAFLLLYVEGKSTVVEEDASTYGYVVDEVHVVHVDDFVVGLGFRVSLEDDLVTSVEFALDF